MIVCHVYMINSLRVAHRETKTKKRSRKKTNGNENGWTGKKIPKDENGETYLKNKMGNMKYRIIRVVVKKERDQQKEYTTSSIQNRQHRSHWTISTTRTRATDSIVPTHCYSRSNMPSDSPSRPVSRLLQLLRDKYFICHRRPSRPLSYSSLACAGSFASRIACLFLLLTCHHESLDSFYCTT